MRGWQVITGAADNWTPSAPSEAAVHSLLPPSGSTAGPLQWPPVISTGLGGFPNSDVPVSGGPGAASSGSSLQRGLSCSLFRGGQPLAPAPSLGLLMPIPGGPGMIKTRANSLTLLGAGLLPPILELPGPLSGPGSAPHFSAADSDRLLRELQEEPVAVAAAAAAAAEAVADGHSSGRSGGGHVDPPGSAAQAAPRKAGAAARPPAPPAAAYHLRTRSSSLRAAWVEKPAPAVEEEAEEEMKEEDEGGELGLERSGSEEGALPTTTSDTEGAPARRPARKAAAAGRKRAAAGASAAKNQPSAKGSAKASAAAAAAAPAPSASADTSGAGGDAGKRLGRPVVYKGDPNAPELTDAERRKIKRRIANRESARRVRAKRAELMDELQIKVTAQAQQNGRLASHAAVLESQRNMLLHQNGLLQQKLSQKSEENAALYSQLFQLRRLLPPELVAQAERDAAAATPPPGNPLGMQGGPGMFVPNTPFSGPAGAGGAPMPGGSGGQGPAGGQEDVFSGDTQAMQGLSFLT